MTLTAHGRKTTPTAAAGTVWSPAVKATAVPDVDGDTGNPVRFRIARPDGAIHTVVATADGDVHTGAYVLDVAGDYTATAVVVDADGKELDELDGFKAIAEAPADPEATAVPPIDPEQGTPIEPDPEPADAA